MGRVERHGVGVDDEDEDAVLVGQGGGQVELGGGEQAG